MTLHLLSGSLGFLGWCVRAYWVKSEQNHSLLRWSAVMRSVLCTLSNVEAHWFTLLGKQLSQTHTGEALRTQPWRTCFQVAWNPADNVAVAQETQKSTLYARFTPQTWMLGLQVLSHTGFQHNSLLQSCWYLPCLAHWKDRSECAAGTYLPDVYKWNFLKLSYHQTSLFNHI